MVEKYTQELRTLGLKILELLCEGLGLDPEYCYGGLSESPLLLTHHYPPCPEPSLTLGAPKHRDPTLLTILLQDKDINALQVFKEGEWIGVEPIPNAFVVNIGLLLQVLVYLKLHIIIIMTSLLFFLAKSFLQHTHIYIYSNNQLR